MKPNKRLAKALSRGRTPKERRVAPSEFVDLVIPSAGEPLFRQGFRYTWGLAKAAGKHPWRAVPLTLSTAFIFTVIKMSLIYVIGLALWGTATPSAPEQRYINAGLWEIFSWAMGPVVLAPWLAASVVAANGLPIRWRLVKEPLMEKGRLLHLLLLGVVALVTAGAVGASLESSVKAVGLGATVGLAGLLYAVFQPTMMMAVTGVWQDGLKAHEALGRAVTGWTSLWKPLLGSALCLLGLAVAIVLLIVVGLALPLSAIGLPPPLMMAVGVVLLPVWLLLWAMFNQVRGGLALAYYDWGQQKAGPPTL